MAMPIEIPAAAAVCASRGLLPPYTGAQVGIRPDQLVFQELCQIHCSNDSISAYSD